MYLRRIVGVGAVLTVGWSVYLINLLVRLLAC
jgi:hypothetical protein